MRFLFLLLISIPALLLRCASPDPREMLGEEEYQQLVAELTPYVHKKPDGIRFAERFSDRLKPYYAKLQAASEGRLRFYAQKDSLHYFYYVRRDHTSLFEHYYGYGGVFRRNEQGGIGQLELFFQTPRLTREEEKERGSELFAEIRASGHAKKFLGNRAYIKTPNADFYYNSRENRWDYTPNSSWNFMQEARAEAAAHAAPE
jgi:hypothetical protein